MSLENLGSVGNLATPNSLEVPNFSKLLKALFYSGGALAHSLSFRVQLPHHSFLVKVLVGEAILPLFGCNNLTIHPSKVLVGEAILPPSSGAICEANSRLATGKDAQFTMRK